MRLENFFTAYKKDLIARQKAVEESILNGTWLRIGHDYRFLAGKISCP